MKVGLVLGLIFLSLLTLLSCVPRAHFSPPVVSYSSQSLDWEWQFDHFILKDSGISLNFEMHGLAYDPQKHELDIGLSYQLRGLKSGDMIFYIVPDTFHLILTSSGKLVWETQEIRYSLFRPSPSQYSNVQSVPVKEKGKYELVAYLPLQLDRPEIKRTLSSIAKTPTMVVIIP